MVGQLGCRVLVSGHGEYASRLAGNLSKSRQFTVVHEEFPREPANSTAPNITQLICICGDHLREVLSPLYAYSEKNTKTPVVVCCPESTPAAVRAAVAAGAQVWLTELSTPLAATTAVEMAIACAEERQALQTRLKELTEKLETQKLFTRAKGIIMRWLQVDEEAAHKIVRKAARDRNLRMRDIAERILLVNELLQPDRSETESLHGQTARPKKASEVFSQIRQDEATATRVGRPDPAASALPR